VAKAGIRKIRLPSPSYLWIATPPERGIDCVREEQMGHSSIQVTVDTYGHLYSRRECVLCGPAG